MEAYPAALLLLSEKGIEPNQLLELVTTRGALADTITAAHSLVNEAEAELDLVQDNRHAAALRSMTDYLRGVLSSLQ